MQRYLRSSRRLLGEHVWNPSELESLGLLALGEISMIPASRVFGATATRSYISHVQLVGDDIALKEWQIRSIALPSGGFCILPFIINGGGHSLVVGKAVRDLLGSQKATIHLLPDKQPRNVLEACTWPSSHKDDPPDIRFNLIGSGESHFIDQAQGFLRQEPIVIDGMPHYPKWPVPPRFDGIITPAEFERHFRAEDWQNPADVINLDFTHFHLPAIPSDELLQRMPDREIRELLGKYQGRILLDPAPDAFTCRSELRKIRDREAFLHVAESAK